MLERKWEELNNDCLVQIFARVGTESLVECIPFVCKSWYRATFDPQCWTTLTFSSVFDYCDFVKYAVGRTQGFATTIMFESGTAKCEDLLCIAEGCPLLKRLIHPSCLSRENSLLFSELIGSWKQLEYLHLFAWNFEQILESISLHCDNFVGLSCDHSGVGTKGVTAIVKFIPKIKFLSMKCCYFSRECLVMILKGCTALETLDVSGCVGFEDGDDEIMKLASHINYFNCTGAWLDDDDPYYYEAISYRDSVLFDDEYNSD